MESLMGMYNNPQTVKKLINQKDRGGVSPIMYAAEKGM